MSEPELETQQTTFSMPAYAPAIRLIVGFASPNQKTWALKRPATIIGSRRPAHIVVHHHAVSESHCAIVNTGRDVILADLHTPGGTLRNGQAVDTVVLNHRDVVTVGDTKLTVEIDRRAGPACPRVQPRMTAAGVGGKPVDRFEPLLLRDQKSQDGWRVKRRVALVGRRSGATVHLDADQVCDAHALLFCCGDTWMVLDLGSRAGVVLNHWPVRLARLQEGDLCQIGSVTLAVGGRESEASEPEPPNEPRTKTPNAADIQKKPSMSRPDRTAPKPVGNSRPAAPAPCAAMRRGHRGKPGTEPGSQLATIKAELELAWARLNKWKLEVADHSDLLTECSGDLSRRIAQLDARDAAMRGLLHDLTRYHDHLVECQAKLTGLLDERASECASERE